MVWAKHMQAHCFQNYSKVTEVLVSIKVLLLYIESTLLIVLMRVQLPGKDPSFIFSLLTTSRTVAVNGKVLGKNTY